MLRALKARLEGGSSETGAAPVVIAAKLAATSRIEPLQYGDDLTGLSAIYAVTNAVRLGIGPYRQLTAGEVHTLFAAGFEFLSARLTPSQVFHSGCRVSVWRSMSQAMRPLVTGSASRWQGLHSVLLSVRGCVLP